METIFIEPKGLDLPKIISALEALIENLPISEPLPETVVKKTITLEQKIEELTKRLQEKINVCFSDMTHPGCDRVELIVSFLAMLELIKRGMIIAKQESDFGEIQINKTV
jgi:segregation and condensation protein A